MEEEGEGQQAAANSELRYIALELMKIAARTKRSFAEVAEEYLDNTELLSRMIAGEEGGRAKEARKASAKEK